MTRFSSSRPFVGMNRCELNEDGGKKKLNRKNGLAEAVKVFTPEIEVLSFCYDFWKKLKAVIKNFL